MSTTREDLTQYSDAELSLRVFNEEWLYRVRHSRGLRSALDELFIYNGEQWAELMSDLESDLTN